MVFYPECSEGTKLNSSLFVNSGKEVSEASDLKTGIVNKAQNFCDLSNPKSLFQFPTSPPQTFPSVRTVIRCS